MYCGQVNTVTSIGSFTNLPALILSINARHSKFDFSASEFLEASSRLHLAVKPYITKYAPSNPCIYLGTQSDITLTEQSSLV